MRPIDADALIAETMKNRCADCDRRKGIKQGKITFVYEFGEVPCRACDVGDMIDTLDEAPTVGGWISVQEKLPEVGKVVLAFGTRSATTGMFQGVNTRNDLWWWKGHTIKHVSHWMPLPEPPKEDES